MPRPRPLADLLITSLRQCDRDASAAGGTAPTVAHPSHLEAAVAAPHDLLDAAHEHRITPAVHRYLRLAPNLPAPLADQLRSRYDQQLLRHLTTVADLDLIAAALDEAGIEWLVMKGPVLADRLWPSPDMREYFDLDVLVDRHHFEDALRALQDAGAILADRNWSLIEAQRRAELSMLLPNGTTLDLHWDLVNDRRTRQQLSVPTEKFLDRARRVRIGARNVRTFDAADTVLTLALHAALSGATKLVWLQDIRFALDALGSEQPQLAFRARATGLDVVLAVMLGKIRRTFASDAPGTDRVAARRAGWSLPAAIADTLWPAPRLPGERHSGQSVYRATRTTSVGSLVAAAYSVVRPPRAEGPGPGNPLHADRPDEAARTVYLHSVHNDQRP